MFDISLLWASFVMFQFFSRNYNGIGFSIWILSLVEGPTAPSPAAVQEEVEENEEEKRRPFPIRSPSLSSGD